MKTDDSYAGALHDRQEEIRAMAQKELSAQLSAQPPKPWVELSIEEKIERTREQLKIWIAGQRHMNARIDTLMRLRGELIEHRHDSCDGGKVMLPADRRKELGDYGNACMPGEDLDPNKVYF